MLNCRHRQEIRRDRSRAPRVRPLSRQDGIAPIQGTMNVVLGSQPIHLSMKWHRVRSRRLIGQRLYRRCRPPSTDCTRHLHKMGEAIGELEMSAEMFFSEKLTQKLVHDFADPLVVAARALPHWWDHLLYEYPCVFTVDTRYYVSCAGGFFPAPLAPGDDRCLGGLANLHSRLTIVRKVGRGDGSHPSVNTRAHYLKLADYSSIEIMRGRIDDHQ